MKKYNIVLSVLIACLLVSCFGKEEPAEKRITIKRLQKIFPEEKGKHIASFDLSEYKNEVTDKIDIWLVERKGKGNSLEMHYRLDFSWKGKPVRSFPVMLDYDDHGEWSAYGNAIAGNKDEQHDSRFLSASFGYPACGYIQTELIFFAADGDIALFDRSEGMADGIYSAGCEFLPVFSEGKANTIYTRFKNVGAAETTSDTLEMLDITFEDSAIYQYDGKKWKREALTKKGEVYRTETMPEDTYYKSLPQ